jgi:hypothetical protein
MKHTISKEEVSRCARWQNGRPNWPGRKLIAGSERYRDFCN